MKPPISIRINGQYGYEFAMLGLSLNRDQDPAKMPAVAARLAGKGHGHDKFMRAIFTEIDITAPRYFWQEFDAYLAPGDGADGLLPTGVVKQSQSTMNTITRGFLTLANFVDGTSQKAVDLVNEYIPTKDKHLIKANLAEGFLQRRCITTNAAVIREMIEQRRTHGLPEWRYFCEYLLENLEHKELYVRAE